MKQRNFLGTSNGLSDFHRFKETLTQIHQDELALRQFISQFLAKPSNQLLTAISERSAYLRAGMESLKELMAGNGIDGGIFYCVEMEDRVMPLLKKAQRISAQHGTFL